MGLGEVLTTPHRKNVSCYEMFTQKASYLNHFIMPVVKIYYVIHNKLKKCGNVFKFMPLLISS